MALAAEQVEKGGKTMNIQLRKRHRYMWMVIGIGLPLLCLTAIENIPTRPTTATILPNTSPLDITNCEPFEVAEGTNHGGFQATMTKSDSSMLIKVKFTEPLKSAFTVAYLGSPEQPKESWKLLGSLESVGDYDFTINKAGGSMSSVDLTFYDALNEKVLSHLTCKMP